MEEKVKPSLSRLPLKQTIKKNKTNQKCKKRNHVTFRLEFCHYLAQCFQLYLYIAAGDDGTLVSRHDRSHLSQNRHCSSVLILDKYLSPANSFTNLHGYLLFLSFFNVNSAFRKENFCRECLPWERCSPRGRSYAKLRMKYEYVFSLLD